MKRLALIFAAMAAVQLHAQPPPPPRPPPPPGGPPAIRRRLSLVSAEGNTTRSLIALARLYLERSEHERPFVAARYLAAADALSHAAEHQQHIQDKRGPEPVDVEKHLERAYFRLQQADFFIKQSADPNAQTIAAIAKQFYQEALRASDAHDFKRSDELAKSIEDLMRALENLAQSTAAPPPEKP